MLDLNEVVEVFDCNHCINRDGFIFTPVGEFANVFDGIIIRNPENCDCWSPKKSFSKKTLKEHIDYINQFGYSLCLLVLRSPLAANH